MKEIPVQEAIRSRCNICNKLYRARNTRDLYCKTCREQSELFRFSDWMTC